MKNIIKSFKLIKYSDGFAGNLLLSFALILAGVFALILTNYAALGCVIMMAGFGVFTSSSGTMSLTESVAVSPRQQIFEKTIPNIITVFGTILTYITLSIIAYLKTSPSSSFYEIKSEEGAIKFYFKGIFAIMLMAILLAAIYKYFILNAIIVAFIPLLAKVLYIVPFLLGGLLGAFPFVNKMLDSHLEASTTLTTPIMIIWGIPAIGLGIVLSIILRIHLYSVAYAISIKNSADRAYKKASKGIAFYKNKVFLVACLVVILVVSATTILMVIDYKKPDGWYDRSDLRAQYRELLEDCNDVATVGDFTFTLTKKYFDAVTGDGCCMFTVESNGKPEVSYNITDHGSTLQCYGAYEAGFDDYYCYLMVDGSGDIHIDYEQDKDNPDKIYAYVYFSIAPDEADKPSIYISVNDRTDEFSVSGTPNVYKKICHYFDLGDTTESIKYNVNGFDMSVSRAGILFYNKVIPKTLNVVMKNGDIIKVVEDSSLIEGFEKYESKTYDKYSFNELIDIKQVDSIEFDGVDYFKNNDKFYKKQMYSACENSNIKETLLTEYDEENGRIHLTYTIEWQNMPRFRETDYILLRFDRLEHYSNSDFNYNVNVTHKVYEKFTNDNGKEYGQWIENKLEESPWMGDIIHLNLNYNDLAIPSGVGGLDIIPNQYSFGGGIHSCGMCICPTLHTDTNNRVYEKECIVIDMELDMVYAETYKNPRIQCFYSHQKENIIGRLHKGDLGTSNVSGIVNCNFIHEIDLDLLEK